MRMLLVDVNLCDDVKPSNLRSIGFGLNAIATIHIPKAER